MAISTVGATGRNYVDLPAWLAFLPATTTEQEVAEMYNDAEFTSASQITISGITTTPTFNLVVRAAAGEGFNDTEQALRYNQTNGVAIRKTTAYSAVLQNSVNYTLIEGIQFSTTTTANARGFVSTAIDTVKDCLIESASNTSAVLIQTSNSDLINTVVFVNSNASSTASAIDISYTTAGIYNCTLYTDFPSNTANGVEKIGGAAAGSVVKNTAIFGFGTGLESGTWGAGTDYNATDFATLPAGSNNQTSLILADQFVNVASASTLDLRLKAGNSLDGNGTPDSGNTNDLDIFGNARSLTAPSIGVYETVAAGGALLVDSVSQIQTISEPTLTQSYILSVDSLSQSQLVNQPLITQNSLLSVGSLSQVQSIDNAVITQAHILSVDKISQNQSIENTSLVVAGALSVQGITQSQVLQNANLIQQNILSVQSLSNSQSVENVNIVSGDTLSVAGLSQAQLLSPSNLVQNYLLFVDDLSQPQALTIVNFGAEQIISGVTVSFKDDGIDVKYDVDAVTLSFNPDNITVNFKED